MPDGLSDSLGEDGAANGAEPRILDTRPVAEFERLHRAGAVNVPLEQLAQRVYELPPPSTLVAIYDASEVRARTAAAFLRERERVVGDVYFGMGWLASGPTESGPSRVRLWEPHVLLREAVAWTRANRPELLRWRALDIACGSGRDAVFLARSGFETEAWDILPDALAQCSALAARCGVSVQTRQRNVTTGIAPAQDGYDLVCCFNFLHRPAMPALAAAVRPGGLIVYETFVRPQRELFGRPKRDAHILRPGELLESFSGWEIVIHREGTAAPRRCVASLIARKPTLAEPF